MTRHGLLTRDRLRTWRERLERASFDIKGDAAELSKLGAPPSVASDLYDAAIRLDDAVAQLGDVKPDA